MDLMAILKIIGLVKGVVDTLPGMIESVKGTLSETDEAKLKAELEALRTANAGKYDDAQAALAARIAKG